MRRRTCLEHGALALSGLTAVLAPPVRAQGSGAKPVRIAAASDLKFALGPLVNQFQRETGQAVSVSWGSSGNMARQIQQGLPVDLFMSADESFINQLADAGLTRVLSAAAGPDRGALYALGRIALYVPQGSPIALDAGLTGLKAQWHRVSKFAIANPEHAPYGRAARQALEALGLWHMVRPKLVLGENIAQATQFVTSGAAQAGITALSLALAPEVSQQGRHVVLPDSLHQPLRQRMVLLKSAPAPAVALYDYLRGAAAREVFRAYGFSQ